MRVARRTLFATLAAVLLLLTWRVSAQVSYDRLLKAGSEPQNWLMYSGTYASQRYSALKQIDQANVRNLEQ